MSYYGTPLRSKSEFECSECGCNRVEEYCWNCDEEAVNELAVTAGDRDAKT